MHLFNFTFKYNLLLFIILLSSLSMFFSSLSASDWNLIGNHIYGESRDGNFGNSIAISRDGTTLVVGAIRDDSGGYSAGKVKVFQIENLFLLACILCFM